MKPLKNWQKTVIFLVVIFVVIGLVYFLYLRTYRFRGQNTPYATPPTTETPQTPSQTPVEPVFSLFYPMTSYNSRVTFRYYGLYVTPAQKAKPCGASFTGYHVADDLEIFPNEVNSTVPVYAVSNSSVLQIGNVSGYGGLLVLDSTINNQKYTVYYGHIDLTSTSLKAGDTVTAGQKLANLGTECSTQTSGERKHLHFAIRKGTAIDVRGYVQTTSELSNWINPKEFLIGNNAKLIQ